METNYTIGEIAELFGLAQSTLRYYESEGLLDPVQRNEGGRRIFTQKEIRRIRFILTLRNAGIPVEEIKQYVKLFHEGVHTIPERKQILVSRLDILKDEVNKLNAVIQDLEEIIRSYEDTLMKRELDSRRNDPNYG